MSSGRPGSSSPRPSRPACRTSTCPSSGIPNRRGTTGGGAWAPAPPPIATRSIRRTRPGPRAPPAPTPLNQAEPLGLSRPTGALTPRVLEFSRAYDPPAYDPALSKKLLAEAGYPNGFDGGDLTPFPPFFGLAEGLVSYLHAG